MTLRILQVAGSAQWAGGERQLLDLYHGLDRSRFTLGFVLPEPGPLAGKLEALGAWTRVVPLSPLGSLAPARALAEAAREFGAQLVQSHGARSNFYARLACREAGRPNIATVHNSLFDYDVPSWRRAAYLAVERLLASRSAAIVCVCRALRRDWVERLGVDERLVRVIYNGIDADAFAGGHQDRVKLRRELNLTEGDWLVGVVGRLTPQKGHRTFLAAFRGLKSRVPKAKAVFAGDGPLAAELKSEIGALGLDGEVKLLGARSDIADVYAGLDAVALPSLSEGLPYAALEALAMGRPLVASAVNGVPEILEGGAGLLSPPGDPAALEQALARVALDAPAAADLASRGRERVKTVFGLGRMLESWTSLYEELSPS